MDMYIPITDAATILHVPIQELQKLVQEGIIRAAMIADTLAVNQTDIQDRVAINERPEYAEFAHLQGTLISLTDSAKKYGIPVPTTSRWIKKGILHIIRRGAHNTAFIDEAEIATIAKLYMTSGGQGKWFTLGGSLYTKRKQRT